MTAGADEQGDPIFMFVRLTESPDLHGARVPCQDADDHPATGTGIPATFHQ
jgi:hypothetical protein